MAKEVENKMRPMEQSVWEFLETVSEKRQREAKLIMDIMKEISGEEAVLWGSSIIGFGTVHYKYESGREGDMPLLGFSPRKAQITVYFSEGFDRYHEQLSTLGKHKTSVSCLYINKLEDVDLGVLRELLSASHQHYMKPEKKAKTVEEYVQGIPEEAKESFQNLRELVTEFFPEGIERISYGIMGYSVGKKKAKLYISGFKDHVGIYPLPKDPELLKELKPHIRGKGTLWFSLKEPLPRELIGRIISDLTVELRGEGTK